MPELAGVFPVLPTPFGSDGRPDEYALHRLADFALESGADGIVYPGMASEVETLTPEERAALVSILGEHLRGRLPFIVGASDPDPARAAERAREGAAHGAIAAMTMAPPRAGQDIPAQTAFFGAVAAACPIPIMLQNAPPPNGAGLAPAAIAAIVAEVPLIRFVKEETLPCGQHVSAILSSCAGKPPYHRLRADHRSRSAARRRKPCWPPGPWPKRHSRQSRSCAAWCWSCSPSRRRLSGRVGRH